MVVLGILIVGLLAVGFFAALYQIFFKADGVHGGELFFLFLLLAGLVSFVVLAIAKLH